MKKLDLLVFFDESGKNNDTPTMMGALSIPFNIYNRPKIYELSHLIRQTDIHWTDYSGDSKERTLITKVIEEICKFKNVIRMNVINYDESILVQHARKNHADDKRLAKRTIHTKFPERIIYGLLRKYGNAHINADVIIERAEEYADFELPKFIETQLNTQSLYRGENYRVSKIELKSKGQEIGLELTDILLGMMRTIINNYDMTESRHKREKIKLIINLLRNELFYDLLTKRIKYYEWSNAKELIEVDFTSYLQAFLTTHYELWYID
ncbi:MAG: DUF3800 domain-containing protein [Tumebacillaceae bacterium]